MSPADDATQQDAHAEHGTVLHPDESALVFNREGELALLLKHREDDEEVPQLELLLAAVAIKARDQDWVAELIEEVFSD